jgi:hypothetical protein
MTEIYPPVPYVTGATLNRYQGRTVRLLGRLTQCHPDNTRFTIETVDNASISITRLPHSTPFPAADVGRRPWLMVTGVVGHGDLTVQENIVETVDGEVDAGLARQVVIAMQKMPALFAV